MERSPEKCLGCKEELNNNEVALILLPCGDELCIRCILQILQRIEPQTNVIVCPVCKDNVAINQKFRDFINKK